MSKPKKPKKKYVPRAIMIPRLISTTDNFDALEAALLSIIETGEVEIDDLGFYVYKDEVGTTMSFESNLRIWACFLDVWKGRVPGRVVDTAPLWQLQSTFEQALPIDEELVETVRNNMALYGKIIKPMAAAEARDVMMTVKIDMAQYRLDKLERYRQQAQEIVA